MTPFFAHTASDNVIAFPSSSHRLPHMAVAPRFGTHGVNSLQAANSPVGPGIELASKVRMRSIGGQTPVAGRMVLTGRLADVCAELNRMAALEACA